MPAPRRSVFQVPWADARVDPRPEEARRTPRAEVGLVTVGEEWHNHALSDARQAVVAVVETNTVPL